MSEKIILGNTAYELVTNGAIFGEDKVNLIFIIPKNKTFEQVEADLTGSDRIVITDQAGETIESRAGYPYLENLTKQRDYVVGVERTEGADAAYTNVTATVMIAVLRRSDMRQELASIRETVDKLVLTELRGE